MSPISKIRRIDVSVTVELEDGSKREIGEWSSSDAALAINNVKVDDSTFFKAETSRIKEDSQRTFVTVSWSEE